MGLLAALVWLFSPGWMNGDVLAFRDTFHFYFPLQIWLDSQVQQGQWFPLWNPSDGLGIGTAGEATTALFYPLRVIWLLPLFSVAQKCSLFVISHLLLGAIGMRVACYRIGLSAPSACLASAAYALSGPVFFQHVNLPYLCSSAWVPLIVAELSRMANVSVHSRDFGGTSRCEQHTSIWSLSFAISMMTLAGDIQSAVNAVLLGPVAILFRVICARRIAEANRPAQEWLTSILLASVLSAVQWIPTLHAALQSERFLGTAGFVPMPADVDVQAGPIWRDLSMESTLPTNRNRGYDFSVPPWHLLSMVWPTVGGHFLPEHSRWFQAIPAEGRVWTPSLYIGLLPCIMLMHGFSFKRTASWRWFALLAVVGVLLAIGNYGPVWFTRQLMILIGLRHWTVSWPPDDFGCPYQLLTAVIPGYSAFRYPGKWICWPTCAMVLLAAMQFDSMRAHSGRLLTRAFSLSLFVVSMAGSVMCLAVRTLNLGGCYDSWKAWIERCPADVWLGRPDADAAFDSVQFSLFLPIAIMASGFLASRLPVISGYQSALVIIMTVIEMSLCARTWISFVPQASMGKPPNVWSNDQDSMNLVWCNLSKANILGDAKIVFPTKTSSDRMQRLCEYQQVFLVGKLHLLYGVRNFGATLSMELPAQRMVRQSLSRCDTQEIQNARLDEYLAWLGIGGRLARAESNAMDGMLRQTSAAESLPNFHGRFVWREIPNPAPFIEAIEHRDNNTENAPPVVRARLLSPTRIQIEMDSQDATQIVVRQHFDGLWRATVNSRDGGSHASPITVQRYARLFQSITVPAGRMSVTLTYFPWPVWLGAVVSVVSWLSVLVGSMWKYRFKNPRSPGDFA